MQKLMAARSEINYFHSLSCTILPPPSPNTCPAISQDCFIFQRTPLPLNFHVLYCHCIFLTLLSWIITSPSFPTSLQHTITLHSDWFLPFFHYHTYSMRLRFCHKQNTMWLISFCVTQTYSQLNLYSMGAWMKRHISKGKRERGIEKKRHEQMQAKVVLVRGL